MKTNEELISFATTNRDSTSGVESRAWNCMLDMATDDEPRVLLGILLKLRIKIKLKKIMSDREVKVSVIETMINEIKG